MWMLVVGLGLFFAAHLVPTFPEVRARMVGALGSGPYSGLFALVSLVAFALIVLGYGQMQGLARSNPELWVPPTWGRHATMLLMVPAMVLLVAAYVPSPYPHGGTPPDACWRDALGVGTSIRQR